MLNGTFSPESEQGSEKIKPKILNNTEEYDAWGQRIMSGDEDLPQEYTPIKVAGERAVVAKDQGGLVWLTPETLHDKNMDLARWLWGEDQPE